jgi:DNA repair protein RadC
MPHVGDDAIHSEPPTLAIMVPDHMAVYTVTLRRSDVVSLRERAIIRTAREAAALFWERLEEADREHLLVLMLDTKQHVIGINTVSVGSLDSSIAAPREVFKPAIITNASSVIISHNHPSGDPTPSQADRQATERIVQAGMILGIEVLNHVIVGEQNRSSSTNEQGIM